jgi:undecaprenyl-diphosphatase
MNVYEKIILDERFIMMAVFLFLIAAFILLTVSVRSGYLAQFDHSVLAWFHKIKNPFLDHFFSSVTWLGSLWILLPTYLLLVVFLSPSHEALERILGIGFFGTILTTYVLKFSLERQRPHWFSTINELPIDPSFPSAHTAQVIAFTLLLWVVIHSGSSLINIFLTIALAVIALGVAVSRMYLQVHYPSDVLAGALVALMWVCIALFVAKAGIFP